MFKKRQTQTFRKNLKALNLAEVMIVMMVISVVTVSAIQVNRHLEEKLTGKLYAKAYKTLSLASFNIQQEVAVYNTKKNMEAKEKGLSGAAKNDLKRFPNIGYNESITSESLCVALKDYMNAQTSSCSITSVSTGYITEDFSLKDETPSFLGTDGMRYYITDLGSGNSANKFFLVFVDLNGERKPNTIMANKTKPDTVPFLIHTDTGDVVPAGYPVYDPKYVQARIIYSSPDEEYDFSVPMPFYNAKQLAYSGREYVLDPMSAKTTGVVDIENYFTKTYPKNLQKPINPNLNTGNNQSSINPYVPTIKPIVPDDDVEDPEKQVTPKENFDKPVVITPGVEEKEPVIIAPNEPIKQVQDEKPVIVTPEPDIQGNEYINNTNSPSKQEGVIMHNNSPSKDYNNQMEYTIDDPLSPGRQQSSYSFYETMGSVDDMSKAKCKHEGYNQQTDFPPCTIEINTHF